MDIKEQQTQIALDEYHWWYRGRRRLINAALKRVALPEPARILDAGCGSGRTLDELAVHGQVSGLDISETAAAVARSRGHADIRVGRVEELPWDDDTFDLIVSLDVIEHTPDDRVTLGELRRVTRPGGFALITVPAYQMLFSAHDVVNHHYRRYARTTLDTAASDAGWKTQFTTYFNSILLPPAAIVRLVQRRSREQPKARSDFEMTPAWMSGLLELPMRGEAAWVQSGRRLPAGLSLLALLAKPSPAT